MNPQQTVQEVQAAVLKHYNDIENNHIIHLGFGTLIKFIWFFANTEVDSGLEYNPDRIIGVPIKVHWFKWEWVHNQKIKN